MASLTENAAGTALVAAPTVDGANNTPASPGKFGLMHRAMTVIAQAGGWLFFAQGDDQQQNEDGLVVVARQSPSTAARFISVSAAISVVSNVLVGGACFIFLSLYWPACGACNRPLRWWLLGQGVLQVSQLPVRIVLLFSLWFAQRRRQQFDACVSSITASPAWRASKVIAVVQYGWLVLGMIWWMHFDRCNSCPWIGVLTGSIMLACGVRAVAAFAAFRLLFSQDDLNENDEPKMVGATQSQIEEIPTVQVEARADGEELNCAICLMDINVGEQVKRLPCKHEFHCGCIAQWLKRKKHCPLCVQPIDGCAECSK